MIYTLTEENYLKAILNISLLNNGKASTNAISEETGTSAASVSDMLKKLHDKKLIKYEKYKGVSLSKKGKDIAINILRKHRLWETFLVEKLNFNWENVHDVAEQLEHIESGELIDKLDVFLGFPKFDPHGEPIPSKDGDIPKTNTVSLSKLKIGEIGVVMGVGLDDTKFLEYLNKLRINIGTKIELLEVIKFDNSIMIKIDGNISHVSKDVAKELFIKL